MNAKEFTRQLNEAMALPSVKSQPHKVMIPIHRPGSIGGTPCVPIESLQVGFDWNSGSILLYPSTPLTALTLEQVDDIQASVRKGQSWHASQEITGYLEKAKKATAAMDAAFFALEADESQLAEKGMTREEAVAQARALKSILE